ncbi:MAG TPA: hypothetical protein VFI25_11980 [Planctomycetota bacterium]|jgi:hypothetical protein|nr:hypothetical protein [Planctomycetota bacterium]
MRTFPLLPLGVLASLPLLSPAAASDIVAGPPTGAPEVFSMRLTAETGGLDVRYALYADGTFAMEDQGFLSLVWTVEPEVQAAFVYSLRTSGFLDLAPERIRTRKAKPGDIVVSLSAYGGAAQLAYPTSWVELPEEVESAQSAFEYLVAHVLVTSGYLYAPAG